MFVLYYSVCSHLNGCMLFYHDVTSGSEITSCNKIDKTTKVYKFSGNIMMSITTLCK